MAFNAIRKIQILNAAYTYAESNDLMFRVMQLLHLRQEADTQFKITKEGNSNYSMDNASTS